MLERSNKEALDGGPAWLQGLGFQRIAGNCVWTSTGSQRTGMMHCYACAPVFKESRRDFGKQIALLKQL